MESNQNEIQTNKNIDLVIKNFGSYIYNYALKLTCNPTAAEDLAQLTFIKAWKNLDNQKTEGAMKVWLSKICLNQFLEEMRKEKRYKAISFDEIEFLEKDSNLFQSPLPSPEDEVLVEEDIKELQNGCFLAMARRLTLNQRIAFSLVDMFGLSLVEVADTLNISKSAAKGLLFRARMNIDSFFSDHCNILNTANPCSCKAWIAFSLNRNALQNNKMKLVDTLDYKEKNYVYNEEVRKIIFYLYSHMPDRKPQADWYQRVKEAIQNMYISSR